MSTEEVLSRVLGLPRRERARVARELLASLEEPDDAIAAAWVDELERRAREVATGKVATLSWEEVREAITAELRGRDAGRVSPGSEE